uniref:Uncharacterized protein n=1 Tax=Zea mays TaxID=4577 RepID=B4FMD4_MAIZE|nr:unknown [Zea mays]|eukprot:NP_001137109.1 uncharacterized protein LOC100217286 [Zea mays]
METAGQTTLQESAVHARRQAACWWPLDTTACSSLDLDDASTFSSSSLLLGWEWDPQLCCFGSPHARDSELFGPTCMESPVSEASAAAATGELDDELLLMSLWGECHLFSSCSALKEKTATSSQRTPKSLQSGLICSQLLKCFLWPTYSSLISSLHCRFFLLVVFFY